MYRAQHPRTWWWDTNVELQAAMLYTLQGANWQRGGGKGARPKQLKRPGDSAVKTSDVPVVERKRRHDNEIARRRRARDARRKKPQRSKSA